MLNVWGRSPASIAMLAAGLHEVSGGRFTLGLGAGSPQLAEGLHDVQFRAPVRRLGAVARQVRALLDGERVTTVDGGRGLRLARSRRRCRCTWPRSGPPPCGWRARSPTPGAPFLQPLSGLKERMCLLEEGAARAGRPRPRVTPGIPTALSPEVAAWWVAFYLTSMGPLYATTLREQGFGAAVDAVVAANGRGVPPTVPAAAQVLVDELLLTERRGPGPLARRGRRPARVVLPPGRPLEELEHTLARVRGRDQTPVRSQARGERRDRRPPCARAR